MPSYLRIETIHKKRLVTNLEEECLVFEPPDIYPAPWSAHRLSRGRTVIAGWRPGNHPAVASPAPDLAPRTSSRTCPSILCVYKTILFNSVYNKTSITGDQKSTYDGIHNWNLNQFVAWIKKTDKFTRWTHLSLWIFDWKAV